MPKDLLTASQTIQADRRLRWQIFTVAFTVRVLYILLAHTYKIRPSDDHFEFGWEMGRIGRALATGFGYSDPFTGHTGPTAWVPPLYPLLVGGVFKLFGVYTKLSAFVLLTVNSLLSAWTAVLCYEIGLRCFSRRCAVWSGWLWALYPAAMQYAVRWVWEMSATAAVFAAILVVMLRLAGVGDDSTSGMEHTNESASQADHSGSELSEGHGFSHVIANDPPGAALAAEARPDQPWPLWAAFGLLWAALAMLNPTPMLLLPITAIYALLARGWRTLLRTRLTKAALAGILFLAALAPWTARNYAAFGRFIPLRDNFGAENFEGNSDWSTGFPWGRTVPLENRTILADYASKGEPAWTADRGARANEWIHTHPKQFAQLSIKRAWMYWAGVPKSVEEAGVLEYFRLMSFQFLSLAGIFGAALAVRRHAPAAWVFALALILLPLPYYAVTVQARFRHVLEPWICVLGVFLFQSATRRRHKATN